MHQNVIGSTSNIVADSQPNIWIRKQWNIKEGYGFNIGKAWEKELKTVTRNPFTVTSVEFWTFFDPKGKLCKCFCPDFQNI